MITVSFINNNGGGFAQKVEVEEGTSIAVFCYEQAEIQTSSEDGRIHAKDWRIRVNRDNVPADYILQDGDKVTITPVNIKGA